MDDLGTDTRLAELIVEYNQFVAKCKLGDETFQHTVFFLLKKIMELQVKLDGNK